LPPTRPADSPCPPPGWLVAARCCGSTPGAPTTTPRCSTSSLETRLHQVPPAGPGTSCTPTRARSRASTPCGRSGRRCRQQSAGYLAACAPRFAGGSPIRPATGTLCPAPRRRSGTGARTTTSRPRTRSSSGCARSRRSENRTVVPVSPGRPCASKPPVRRPRSSWRARSEPARRAPRTAGQSPRRCRG
jgi:hypothetical protein